MLAIGSTSAAEASGAPIPATLIAALPSAGHGGAAAGAAAACTVTGSMTGGIACRGQSSVAAA